MLIFACTYSMKYKIPLLFLTGFILIAVVYNSCKKNDDQQTAIPALFTNGYWQLASLTVTRTDSGTVVTDTLNATCNQKQIFTFNADKTCTYSNFDCLTQTAKGTWSLSKDQLTLMVPDMVCIDTISATKKGMTNPFVNAQIYNLGQYSMVLQTGDYNIIPTSTNKTRVMRYGFVRQKTIN